MLSQFVDDAARVARRYTHAMDAPPGVDVVQLGSSYYPKERVAKLYEKLTTPPIIQNDDVARYYDGDRVRGYLNREDYIGTPSTGSVSFMTHYPETDWNYSSPEELGIISSSPKPMREMAKMARSFENLLDSNQGKGLLVNTPISAHRGKAYEKVGFAAVNPGSEDPTQFLDNRRFQDSKTLAELYLKGDIDYQDPDLANATAQGLLDRHSSLSNARDHTLEEKELAKFMRSKRDDYLPYAQDVTQYSPELDEYVSSPGIEVLKDVPEYNYYAAQNLGNTAPIKYSPEYVIDQIQQRGLSPEQFINHAYRDYSPEWGDRFSDLVQQKRPGQSKAERYMDTNLLNF